MPEKEIRTSPRKYIMQGKMIPERKTGTRALDA